MTDRPWFIYVLSSAGVDFYVGRTWNCEKRKSQHQRRFGKDIQMRVVENGTGKEECKTAEIRWIEKLLSDGVELANRMVASIGAWKTGDDTLNKLKAASTQMWRDPEYRRKHNAALRVALSDSDWREHRRKSAKEAWERPAARARMLPQIKLLGKRPRTPEQNAALSAKTKGKRKNWSEEGEQRVQTTQFKPGHDQWAHLSEEKQECLREVRRRSWDGISQEERSRMSTERNLQAWAKRDSEQRRQLGNNISQGIAKRFSEEERQARAAFGSAKAAAKWKSMTPEQKAEIIARRNATAKANRELKAKAASV